MSSSTYYLNHVGYKDKRGVTEAANRGMYGYYLNHVGYKDTDVVEVTNSLLAHVLSEPCGI